MRIWNRDYWGELSSQFKHLTRDLKSKLDQVVAGKVVPSIAYMPLGSARKLNAAVLFFDLRGSSNLPSPVALYTLNVVIPSIMRIVHDHDGYIEKNTGDGVMAIFAGAEEKQTCKSSLQCALASFCFLQEVINPHFLQIGLQNVEARIGIDFGEILLSRVGVPKGSARQDRSFLTAIGAAPNIACRLQEQAGTNEIWVGDAVKVHAPAEWVCSFIRKSPSEWNWVQKGNTSQQYAAWHFNHQLAIPTASLTPSLPRGLCDLIPPPLPAIKPPSLLDFTPPESKPPTLAGLLGLSHPTVSPDLQTPEAKTRSIIAEILKNRKP